MMELSTLITVNAAAKKLNLSRHTIYKAVRLGQLKTVELPGNHVLITPEQLAAYVALRRDTGNRDGELTPADGVRMVELADLASCKTHVVRDWKYKGKLFGVKVAGKVLVPWDEARRFLEVRGVDAGDRLERLQAEKEANAA